MEKKKKEAKGIITKDMLISEIVSRHPELVETFFRNGLYCVGCHQASQETLEQACQVHGIDCNKMLMQLNKQVKIARKTVRLFGKQLNKKPKQKGKTHV